MIIDPFSDRFELLLELSDDDLNINDLEEYLCKAFSVDRLVEPTSVNFFDIVLYKKPKNRDLLDRFYQFCEARKIMVKDYESKNYNFTIFLGGIAAGELSKEMCHVVNRHSVIDKRGNIYPCLVMMNSGEKPITTVEKYLKECEEIEKLLKSEEQKDKEKAYELLKHNEEEALRRVKSYVNKSDEHCKGCYSEYANYNNMIRLFNLLNKDFRIS